MQNIINNIKDLKIRDWTTICFSILLVIGHSGIWLIPNIEMLFNISQNLLHVPFEDPNAHYLFWNYFQPLVFWLFGGRSYWAYIIYCSLVTFLFLVLFILWFVKHNGKEKALDENTIFVAVAFPVFFIPFYWIGMDGMTLLLMLLIMMTFNTRWVFVPSFFLGLQHFEQGFVGFCVLLGTIVLAYIIYNDKKYIEIMKKLLLIIIVLVIAKLILSLFFYALNVGIKGDRWTWLKNHYQILVGMWLTWWYLILYSFFGVAWIIIVKKIKKKVPLIVAIIGVFFITIVIDDQTRVGTIVLFPSLFFWVFSDKEIWINMTKRFVLVFVSLYLLVPVCVVWGGPFNSLVRYDWVVAKKFLSGENKIDLLMPFKPDNSTIKVIKSLQEYKARINVIEPLPKIFEKSSKNFLQVKIENNGKETWPCSGPDSSSTFFA